MASNFRCSSAREMSLPMVTPSSTFHAGGQDGVDVLLQFLPGQPVAGNAVAEHTAQLFPGLKYRDLVAHQGDR